MDHYSFTLAERTIMTHITGSFMDEFGNQIINSFKSALERDTSFSVAVFQKKTTIFLIAHVGTVFDYILSVYYLPTFALVFLRFSPMISGQNATTCQCTFETFSTFCSAYLSTFKLPRSLCPHEVLVGFSCVFFC